MADKKLFSDFQEVTAKAWKQQIQFDLKGADYNETLVWESPEGIKVKPFYHQDDRMALESTIPKKGKDWKIGHSIYAGNAIMANEKALDFLQKGVEGILFIIPSEAIEIDVLLKGIDIELAPVYFELQFLSVAYVKAITTAVGVAGANVFLNIDIIGNLARSGNWYGSLEKDHQALENILDIGLPNVLQVDISLYQNAGANMIQQLAYALSHANEYLNQYANLPGRQGGEALHSLHISFKVSVGTNYFFEIAKLRALRLLWKTLSAEYGITSDCHISAQPSKRNKTLYDYNINMLRTTTECMSAVLGGADVVFNVPYDDIYHKTNAFGDRIAVNQLLLLKNESHLDKVANAADGTYYIENLTHQLAEKALGLFKTIEKEGGFLKLLKAHSIQTKITESAQKEQAKFDAEEEVLVGTNKFQNANDKMNDDLELYPFVKTNARKTLIEPIIEKRLAEALEKKRLEGEG